MTWLALLLAISAGANQSFAASGGPVTSMGKGLTLTISTQWFDGGGYRPIEVLVVPATPPVADQTLHIELHASQNFYANEREIAVSQDIDLPAGTSGVVETIAVPQEFSFQAFKAEVWLNGRYSTKLSQPARAVVGAGAIYEGLPNVLVIGPAATPAAAGPPTLTPFLPDPGSEPLMSVFPAEVTQQQFGGFPGATKTVTTAGIPLPTLLTVPYDRLPRRWIELTSIDLVCVSLASLEQLAAHEPERCQALRHWLMSGGNVIVYDTGPAHERADVAARLLAPNATLASGLIASDWSKPIASDFGNRLKSYGGVQTPMIADAGPVPDPAPFALRRFGDGMLLAADTNDLFAQPAQHWIWMLNSLGSDRWLGYRRHGLSFERKNADFWNWLVRGVGLAPVTEFRVLITAFVLAIGPLNYYWLRRRGRLHLLVVVVPVAACIVTFGLFGYAIFADGLDVRVRARTLTRLDQKSGQAVCWSRISYYAGLAPSGGLVFPDDVVVLPLTANEGDASDMPHRQNLIWSTHRQELVSGWLPSRTPMQFITVRSRASQAGLRFLSAKSGERPQVENQLGSRVVRLLLADEAGRYFTAADIAAGARNSLVPVDNPADEVAAIYEFVTDRQPGVPEGFVPPASYGYSSRRRYYRYWSAINNSLSPASLASSRLEAGMREAIMGPGLHGSWMKPNGFALPRRSYLAVVERSPEVVFGVENPREEDSLHVIVGSW